ncbi:protein NO VEIN domain-containing protein [Moraxella oculi]|uniref:Protein NO VEIN domain-containing protein n=1 Tax=Moraxella oculi TaxID=2940516 RepID=A0ABW8U4L9_9GAMM
MVTYANVVKLILQDARLFGDDHDFQITRNSKKNHLAEVKRHSPNKGKIRLTENEYLKA